MLLNTKTIFGILVVVSIYNANGMIEQKTKTLEPAIQARIVDEVIVSVRDNKSDAVEKLQSAIDCGAIKHCDMNDIIDYKCKKSLLEHAVENNNIEVCKILLSGSEDLEKVVKKALVDDNVDLLRLLVETEHKAVKVATGRKLDLYKLMRLAQELRKPQILEYLLNYQ